MRATLAALAMCLPFLLAPAGAAARDHAPFSGFYAGLGGGWAATDVAFSRTSSQGALSSGTARSQAAQGQLFLGSMTRLGRVHLGVEMEMAARPLTVELDKGERLESAGFFGARVLLGMSPWRTGLVYLAPGVRLTSFRYAHDAYEALDGGARTAHGLALGAGLEQMLAAGLFLRLEAGVTRWSALEVDYAGEDAANAWLTMEPVSHGVGLGLGWDF